MNCYNVYKFGPFHTFLAIITKLNIPLKLPYLRALGHYYKIKIPTPKCSFHTFVQTCITKTCDNCCYLVTKKNTSIRKKRTSLAFKYNLAITSDCTLPSHLYHSSLNRGQLLTPIVKWYGLTCTWKLTQFLFPSL